MSPKIATIGRKITAKILNNSQLFNWIPKFRFKKINKVKIKEKMKEKMKPSIDFLGEKSNFQGNIFLPKIEPKI